jgi:hypothetical protein
MRRSGVPIHGMIPGGSKDPPLQLYVCVSCRGGVFRPADVHVDLSRTLDGRFGTLRPDMDGP